MEVAGEGALFAALFVGGFEGLGIEGDGGGVVEDAGARGGDLHGDEEVVEDGIGGDGGKEGGADGVDGAGAADGGIEARFGGAEGFFEAPIGIDAGADGGESGIDFERAADGTDGGIGEVGEESGDGVGGEALAGVGEDDKFVMDGGEGGIDAGGFA